jgi:probable HAF family extracellular repeat protein
VGRFSLLLCWSCFAFGLGSNPASAAKLTASVDASPIGVEETTVVRLFLDLEPDEEASVFEGVFDLNQTNLAVVIDETTLATGPTWESALCSVHFQSSKMLCSMTSENLGGRRLLVEFIVATLDLGTLRIRVSDSAPLLLQKDIEGPPFLEDVPLDNLPGEILASIPVAPALGDPGLLDLGAEFSALDASSDASVIVGGELRAILWENGVSLDLGVLPDVEGVLCGFSGMPSCEATAQGVSDTGVVVGESDSADDKREAFRWQAGTIEGLGFLEPEHNRSSARSISSSGSVIVGMSVREEPDPGDSSGDTMLRLGEPVVWAAGAITGLGVFGDATFGDARSVSADGSIIVGENCDGTSCEAFRWESDSFQGLGLLPGGTSSTADAISADGHLIVGSGTNGSGQSEAILWNDGGTRALGFLAEDHDESRALAASNGFVIVGESGTAELGMTAFLWTPAAGLRTVSEVLTDLDVDAAGWEFERGTSISPDGSIVVGEGRNPDGEGAVWIAFLPEPSMLVCWPVLACGLGFLVALRSQVSSSEILLSEG